MRAQLIAALVVASAFSALPAHADTNDATYDGIVTDSSAVPRSGTVRLTGAVGSFGPAEGVSAKIGISWTIIPALCLTLNGIMENNAGTPADRFAASTPVIGLR